MDKSLIPLNPNIQINFVPTHINTKHKKLYMLIGPIKDADDWSRDLVCYVDAKNNISYRLTEEFYHGVNSLGDPKFIDLTKNEWIDIKYAPEGNQNKVENGPIIRLKGYWPGDRDKDNLIELNGLYEVGGQTEGWVDENMYNVFYPTHWRFDLLPKNEIHGLRTLYKEDKYTVEHNEGDDDSPDWRTEYRGDDLEKAIETAKKYYGQGEVYVARWYETPGIHVHELASGPDFNKFG